MQHLVVRSRWEDWPAFPSEGFLPTGLGGGCRRKSALHRVRLRPYSLAASYIQAIHCYFRRLVVNLEEQMVLIHVLTLERTFGSPFNGISVSRSAAGDEVVDAVTSNPAC